MINDFKEENNLKIDLHTHTTFSDGANTPKELLNIAKKKNIEVISITDHDTVDGIDEALEYGKEIGIEVIPGLELSTDIEGQEVHILGYFINHKDIELNKYLKFFRDERFERAKRIIGKLNNLGIDLKLSDVENLAKNSPICRPHIANAMVQKGFVNNFQKAFNQFIGDYKPAYEKKIHVSPQSVIKIINDSGGLAFIAHPGKMKESILTHLIKLGIDGIEVIHPSHKHLQQKFYKGIVNQYCLLESGGSDYHSGSRNDENNFGKYYTTKTVLKNLKNMVSSKVKNN